MKVEIDGACAHAQRDRYPRRERRAAGAATGFIVRRSATCMHVGGGI